MWCVWYPLGVVVVKCICLFCMYGMCGKYVACVCVWHMCSVRVVCMVCQRCIGAQSVL